MNQKNKIKVISNDSVCNFIKDATTLSGTNDEASTHVESAALLELKKA